MRVPFTLRMAWRESRSSRRRFVLYTGSIAAGVAALVAINSFRENVRTSVASQSKALLGADVSLRTRREFAPEVVDIVDSLRSAGVPTATVVTFASMALAVNRNSAPRLVEVRAIEGAYPFYGDVVTDPPGVWPALQRAHIVLVDPAVLIHLEAKAGDTLQIGEARLVIGGTVAPFGWSSDMQAAVLPRVYMPGRFLDETRLLSRGSRVRYTTYLQFDDPGVMSRFLNGHFRLFERYGVNFDTAAETGGDVAGGLDTLARFLGLVGLIALLLGGIGVASAIHVFIKDRLDTVALLRCLGARQPAVFTIYLLQAGGMGLIGAVAGAILGVGAQIILPRLIEEFVPLDIAVSLNWPAILGGIGLGVWVALIFSLLPLLALRDVTPLQALRRDVGPPPRGGGWPRLAVWLALISTVVFLSWSQSPRRNDEEIGFGFAAAVLATIALLWVTATVLMRGTRRFFPQRAAYVVRQGIANLSRPQNQTVAVTIALGFGVFLVTTLYIVQRNLLDRFVYDTRSPQMNLALFDIQLDQKDGVVSLLREQGHPAFDVVPLVPSQIAAINGRRIFDLLADTSEGRGSRWALRRDYRNTYRDSMVGSERLVAGEWWGEKGAGGAAGAAGAGDSDGSQSSRRTASSPAPRAPTAPSAPDRPLSRISLEDDVAAELRVGVGDRITWDVQGVKIETQVASLRRVEWARFQLNFFAVFEPGVLERAPQMFVTLVSIPDDMARATLVRALVLKYPNVSAIDLALVQQTVDAIIRKVSLAIRFMALFSIAGGLIILIGAISTSKFQRMRECVLLKTLGAGSRQIFQILCTEYFAIGSLAALTGTLLAGIAGWALTTFVFEMPFDLPVLAMALLWIALTMLTMTVGLLNSRDVVRRPPLAVIRELAE